jgi:hypothetical protein
MTEYPLPHAFLRRHERLMAMSSRARIERLGLGKGW